MCDATRTRTVKQYSAVRGSREMITNAVLEVPAQVEGGHKEWGRALVETYCFA